MSVRSDHISIHTASSYSSKPLFKLRQASPHDHLQPPRLLGQLIKVRRDLPTDPPLDRLPINHMPNLLCIILLLILILQIISMLPHIHPEQRLVRLGRNVLVLGRDNRQHPRLPVLHQPPPPAPLQTQQRRLERLLERLHAGPVLHERGVQGGGGLYGGRGGGARGGSQVLPE